MEKFRKFDDASCGVNPYVPRKEAKRPIWQLLFKVILVPVLVLVKGAGFGLLFSIWSIMHLLKHVLIVGPLVRVMERLIDKLLGSLFLSFLGTNAPQHTLHQDDAGYSPDPKKREANIFRVGIEPGDVVICNQASILDTLYLICNYSPVFTQIATNGKRVGFRVLGFYERMTHGLGIGHPQEIDNLLTLEEVREANSRRPIIVYPEGTKTNGMGVLQFPEEVSKQLLRAKPIHAIRFDYIFTYFSPYNTTERRGIWYWITLLSQTINSQQVQFHYNVHKKFRDVEDTSEQIKILRTSLTTRQTNNLLNLDYTSHSKFLEYWDLAKQKGYQKNA